jgi:spoIIIJ-associated protein
MVTKNKIETFLEKTTRDLLNLLGLEVDLEIKKEDDLIKIQIETEEPGLLIGYHGQTLDGLQRWVSLALYHQRGEWIKILVNVNDYRERRRQRLEKMAHLMAQRVKFSGESQALPPMSSFERRLIHLALADDSEVETVSEGEGSQRRVIVEPRSESEEEKKDS